jgi:alpha-glucosidase
VVDCLADGDILDVTIPTSSGYRYRGLFSNGAGQPGNALDIEPLIAADLAEAQGWIGVVRRGRLESV